jgi:hypothetical protein
MNDYNYRRLIRKLEMEQSSARRALDVRDLAGLEYWMGAMKSTAEELDIFMRTHEVGK